MIRFVQSVFILGKLLVALEAGRIGDDYQSFQYPAYGEFGLVNAQNVPCLLLKFHTKLYNFNLNSTDIATELTDFVNQSVKIYGYCALHNEIRKQAQLQASWRVNERRKMLRFHFRERFIPNLRHNHPDELRWELDEIKYSENYKGRSVSFLSSSNDSALITAPLNQKFLCKDRLNITLRNPKYANIIMELLPEIDMQPVNTGAGFGSNVYICERTRRRTLRESFQSRVTIFSGFVLGLSSVSVLIGHSLRRHLNLARMNVLARATTQNKNSYNAF